MTVKWRGDQQVRQNIAAYGQSVHEKVRLVANFWKPKLEEYAKENAPGRTGRLMRGNRCGPT